MEHRAQGACGKQPRSYFISSFLAIVRGDILLEELVLALGVLGSVLLERLVLDQTHVGTALSARFRRSLMETHGNIIKVLVVASVSCFGPDHLRQIHFSSHLGLA